MADSADLDRGRAVLARRGPHPIGTYREPAPADPPFPAEHTLYVSCTNKPAGDPMLRIAAGMRAAGGAVVELDAGHFAVLTADEVVASLVG